MSERSINVVAVIAAYDEAATIEALTRRLAASLARVSANWQVIYALDGGDPSREILQRLAAELGVRHIQVLHEPLPQGFAAAFRRGFAALPTHADYVVTMDADLNHQPEEIPTLLTAAVERDLDVVVGSRFVPGARVDGTPRWKSFLSRTMNVVIRHLFSLSVLDKTSGFRIYRAAVLPELLAATRLRGFELLPEILVAAERRKLRLAELPIHFSYRRQGKSKMRIGATIVGYLRLLARSRERLRQKAGQQHPQSKTARPS